MKVFSKEKLIENMGCEEYQKVYGNLNEKTWIDICDKLTVEECHKKGFLIADDWCIEVNEDES